MAGKQDPSTAKDYVEEGKNVFKAKSGKRLAKQIEKARQRALKQQDALLKSFLHTNPPAVLLTGLIKGLARSKRTMLAQRTLSMPKPSMRSTIAGSRPFHFAHSHVRSDGSIGGTGQKASLAQKPGSAKVEKHGSTGAAHMNYLERPGAIEKLAKFAEHDIQYDDVRDMQIDAEIGIGLDPTERAKRMQEYVENDLKVETVKKKDGRSNDFAFSFGTIGDTPQQRQDFWTLVEKHKERGKSRLQYRLILELPHQASPEARHETVRKFCEETFGKQGLPYWAVLHAPTAKNDSRNFHAHIVYLARPAKKIDWPEGGKTDETEANPEWPLKPTWDFLAVEKIKDKFRKVRDRYPHRQNVLDVTRTKSFVKDLRKTYARIVNETMERHRVPVRYDPRSYADMGVKSKPMASHAKGIHDALKGNKLLGLDPDEQDRQIKAVQNRISDVAYLAHRKKLARIFDIDARIKAELDTQKSYRLLQQALPRDLKDSALVKLARAGRHKIRQTLLERQLDRESRQYELSISQATLKFIADAAHPDVLKKARGSMAQRILTLDKKRNRGEASEVEIAALGAMKKQLAAIPPDDILVAIHQKAVKDLNDFNEKHRGGLRRLAPYTQRIRRLLFNSGAVEDRRYDPSSIEYQRAQDANRISMEQRERSRPKPPEKLHWPANTLSRALWERRPWKSGPMKEPDELERIRIKSIQDEKKREFVEMMILNFTRTMDAAVADLPPGAHRGVAIHLAAEEIQKSLLGDKYQPPSEERKANMFLRPPDPDLGEPERGPSMPMGYEEALAKHRAALAARRERLEREAAKASSDLAIGAAEAPTPRTQPINQPPVVTIKSILRPSAPPDPEMLRKKKTRRKAILSQRQSRGREL